MSEHHEEKVRADIANGLIGCFRELSFDVGRCGAALRATLYLTLSLRVVCDCMDAPGSTQRRRSGRARTGHSSIQTDVSPGCPRGHGTNSHPNRRYMTG